MHPAAAIFSDKMVYLSGLPTGPNTHSQAIKKPILVDKTSLNCFSWSQTCQNRAHVGNWPNASLGDNRGFEPT